MLLTRTIPEIFSDLQKLDNNDLPYCTEVTAWIFLPVEGDTSEVWNVCGCNATGYMEICQWEPTRFNQVHPVVYRQIESDTSTRFEVEYTILPHTDPEDE